MNIYIPFTYLIGWSELNLWYYGVRYKTNCEPSDLWTKYFTSSGEVRNLRESAGEPDVIQIRKTFNTAEEAVKFEHKVLRRLNAVQNKKWLNLANGWQNLNRDFLKCPKYRAKQSASKIGIKKSEEHRKNISKGRTGIQFTQEHIENIRQACTGVKQSKKTKKKRADKISKLKWWNNGSINKRSIKCPGDDFVPGRIKGFKWKKS